MSFAVRTLPLPVLALIVAAGCETKPRAPVMSDDPVYQNDQLGLRFTVPEGWTQYANSMIPPGPQSKARLVVAYRSTQFRGAAFEVSIIDLPANADLRAMASEPSHGVKDWTSVGEPEPINSGSRKGQRFRFSGIASGDALIKEVSAFRGGDRVACFTLLADQGDTGARSAARRAVESASWRE